jgi:hypothetical protein
MRQGRRPVVPQFSSKELLTFRFYKNDLSPDGRLKSSGMPVPDQSMNRLGLDGKLWFALLPDPKISKDKADQRICMGVVGIRYVDLPTTNQIDGTPYTFTLAHDPLPYNYQHCELRLFQASARITKESPSLKGRTATAIKKYYREILADRARVLLHAEV